MHETSTYKSSLAVWIPFGLRRIDFYYIRYYLKAFCIILVALSALIAIGDLFQRFDDFVMLSRRDELELGATAALFGRYYLTFVPQLIFQYMFPLVMLLAATMTVTASFAGPRGNNEYIVIRSAGVPVLRSFFPLLFPALIIALSFQAGRDSFLPDMIRESNTILNRLRMRVSNPTNVALITGDMLQTVAIGWFSSNHQATNMILEIRDMEKYRRGDAARGDNDFVAYRAALARLEPGKDGRYQWVPLENAEVHTYTRFARRAAKWTEPVPTDITPAMIERQTLGDSVCSWKDLLIMREDYASAKFELHWRLAEPAACILLILWGTGFCMARMLRGSGAGYIQNISLSMLAAAVFYIFRLGGKSLWESGMLTPSLGVWLPLAAAAVVTIPIALWMER